MGVSHYETETSCQEKSHHKYNNALLFKKKFLYVILFCWNKIFKILWIRVPRTLFSGQKPDAISLVVQTLGVGVALLSSELAEVSATVPLY